MRAIPASAVCVITLFATPGHASEEPAGEYWHRLEVGGGYAAALEFSAGDGSADGATARVTYALTALSWLEPRATGGILITFPDESSCEGLPCVHTNIFFVNAGIRLVAPFTWVKPYVESGVGLSLGKIELDTLYVFQNKNATYNIPFALGFVLGKDFKVDVGLDMLIHPDAELFVTGFLFGIGFRVGSPRPPRKKSGCSEHSDCDGTDLCTDRHCVPNPEQSSAVSTEACMTREGAPRLVPPGELFKGTCHTLNELMHHCSAGDAAACSLLKHFDQQR